MARIVFAAGVPHTPYFPAVVRAAGSGSRIAQLFGEVRRRLEAAAPDVLVVVTSDHFVKFFFDNMPAFCVGVVDDAEGPHENGLDLPRFRAHGHRAFADAFLAHGMNAGFDLASAEELWLDHSILVPLHFLTPDARFPIVPLYVKGLARPLPRSQRCYQLGEMLAKFVARRPQDERVAVLATGSFSLEVGGPTMGRIDARWAGDVGAAIREGRGKQLVRRATPQRLARAGNTGGELLNWIVLLGAVGSTAPSFFEADAQPADSPRDAHAYAAWELAS